MEARISFIHALTPMHTGTGQSVDVVDLPVSREKTTGWPQIPGSGIKGVLRDMCRPVDESEKKDFIAVFGPDTEKASESASKLIICDAHLLCLPVRSFKGTFAWVTCPSALIRLQRDMMMTGRSLPDIPSVSAYDRVVVCNESTIVHRSPGNQNQPGKVLLEDLDLTQEPGNAAELAGVIAGFVFEGDWINRFKNRFAIVSDDLFCYLTETATEVVARIKLKENTKTVARGGLWYEEAVPAETIFWSLTAADPRNGATASDIFGYVEKKKIEVLQLGGNASVGRGIARFVLGKGVA